MSSSDLLSIGQVARSAGIATSAIRYYERRGLVTPTTRVSGQRRYTAADLRKVVFIGMLQDAGLTLDDIDGILNSESVREWKAIARLRLAALKDEIARLTHAHDLLDGAMLCRYDHPMNQCKIMGAEIDRRLDVGRRI